MEKFEILTEDFVLPEQILQRIRYSLRNKVSFSLVRIGDAENQILAQGVIYNEKQINLIAWANDENYTGITLPNYEARDKMIQSLKKADMVGVLDRNEVYTWKPLTEKLFPIYDIRPKQICSAFVNTNWPDNYEFISLMKSCRLLLIGKPAEAFAQFLYSRYRVNAAAAISIKNYSEITDVLSRTSNIDYDLALLSAGSNAVILAAELARRGKVAIDFGHAMDIALWKKKRAAAPYEGSLTRKWRPPFPLLNSSQLMDKILQALDQKKALSVVSLGATEAFTIAQYVIFSHQQLLDHPETAVANQGIRRGFYHRGIRFPNIDARNEAAVAAAKADIIAYNTIVEEARVLAEKVLAVYNITPPYIFEANLRRVIMISQKEKFNQMLKGRKILLIGSRAAEAKLALEQSLKAELGFNIIETIKIYEYEDIPRVKQQLKGLDFDLCLLSAGVNAFILAPYIAETYGKVAFDIGSGLETLITGQIVEDEWLSNIIGIDKLLQM